MSHTVQHVIFKSRSAFNHSLRRVSEARSATDSSTFHRYTPQPFYGPFSRTTWVSRCQKRTSWLYGARQRLTEADTPTIRLGATPTGLTSAQLPTSTIPQAGCPSCRPTNSVKALKAKVPSTHVSKFVCHRYRYFWTGNKRFDQMIQALAMTLRAIWLPHGLR